MEKILTKDGYDVDKIGVMDLVFEIHEIDEHPHVKPYFVIHSQFASSVEDKFEFPNMYYLKDNAEAELFRVKKLTHDIKPKSVPMEDVTIASMYLSEAFEHLVQPQFVVWAMNYVREFPELTNAEAMDMAFKDWVKTCPSECAMAKGNIVKE